MTRTILFKWMVLLAVVGGLVGCAVPPSVVRGLSEAMGTTTAPEGMDKVNLTAVVYEDEVFSGKGSRALRANLIGQGIYEGYPLEYYYRSVMLKGAQLKGLLYYSDGQYPHITLGVVPDHLPALKTGDIVEYRQIWGLYQLTDFATKNEGVSVLRILCRKAQPDYEACRDTVPHVGKYKAVGPTGTPFLPSLKDYGFTYTRMYDDNGNQLRPFPPDPVYPPKK